MKLLYSAYKYLIHILRAKNSNGFGVHSPFLFYFTTHVIYEKHQFYAYRDIEKRRQAMLLSSGVVEITDFGTGVNRKAEVKKIASRSLKKPEYGQLFFRIVRFLNARTVFELGTSLGITTAYLAAPDKNINCYTFEGCRDIARLAEQNFETLHLDNIHLVKGNIDVTLPGILNENVSPDFIFIDANHCSDALFRYFELFLPHIHENTIVVVDDIYWSADMTNGWVQLKTHPKVTSSIDLFSVGILFFKPELYKKHYVMRF